MKRLEKIPHTCTDQELLVHALAAKAIIDKYRRAAQPVTDFWALCQSSIDHCLLGGNEYKYKGLTFSKEQILLPNGMKLRYPDIKFSKEKGVVYGPDETKLYGGKLTENIVQALARIVMTDGMLRTQKRYSVCLTVHDEEGAIVPDAYAQEAEQWVLEQMTVVPKYMEGIPLAAEVSSAKRYGDAK
jgi:DNA polymerase